MRQSILTLVFGLAVTSAAAQAPDAATPTDAEELHMLLHEFMAGASTNDIQAHDRFWDENLVYTSSNGDRYGKREIMASVVRANDQGEEGPDITYLAENIEIQQYGNTAVVAFRLIGVTHDPGVAGQTRVDNYFNTGTFVRRGGAWRAVAWQATRIPAD